MRAILLALLCLGLLASALAPTVAAQGCACDPNPWMAIVFFVILPCAGAQAAELQGQGEGCFLFEPFEDAACARVTGAGITCPLP